MTRWDWKELGKGSNHGPILRSGLLSHWEVEAFQGSFDGLRCITEGTDGRGPHFIRFGGMSWEGESSRVAAPNEGRKMAEKEFEGNRDRERLPDVVGEAGEDQGFSIILVNNERLGEVSNRVPHYTHELRNQIRVEKDLGPPVGADGGGKRVQDATNSSGITRASKGEALGGPSLPALEVGELKSHVGELWERQ